MVQLIMLAVFAAFVVFALTRWKKMAANAPAQYGAEVAKLKAECEAMRLPGETEPAFVMVFTKKLTNNRSFFLGLSDQRVFVKDTTGGNMGRAMSALDRQQCPISAVRKKWSDQGNMQVTVSEGWEVELGLPNDKVSDLRLYGEWEYLPDQATNVPIFLRELGVA